MIKTSVSSLPFNDNIIESLSLILNSNTDFLHLDIMDGSLTKNKTFSFDKVEEINNNTTIVLDCHLMIDEPNKILENFVKAGCNIITIHYEAFKNKLDLINALTYLKENNIIVGLSIYPETKIDEILPYENYFDLLLIMSVNIGKYGQSFIETTFNKIKEAKEKLPTKLIEVDGGINLENIEKLKELNVDIVVLGSSFKNAENKAEFITKIKK